MHLVIDGYEAAHQVLEDKDLIYRFLDEYPETIGMTKMAPPQVRLYHGKVPQDWGISGFVLIAESHISVHTFPARGYVNVDVFSCKDFDSAACSRDIKRLFSLPQMKTWTMDRGVDFSTSEEARVGTEAQRANLTPTRYPADG